MFLFQTENSSSTSASFSGSYSSAIFVFLKNSIPYSRQCFLRNETLVFIVTKTYFCWIGLGLGFSGLHNSSSQSPLSLYHMLFSFFNQRVYVEKCVLLFLISINISSFVFNFTKISLQTMIL